MTKIFIVEDDEIIVKAIKIALEKEFQVRSVSNFRAVKQEIMEFEAALLRRSYSFSGIEKLEFAGYVLSENTLISTQEGEREEIELTSSENKILTLLFRGNGEVVTKEKILQELWQTDEFIDANTLNVKMTRLRKKLGEIGFDKHIMTKRGSGYALV